MKPNAFAAALAVTMLACGAALLAQNAAAPVITGRVVDASTGAPVSFARITPGGSTTTPADLADGGGWFSVRRAEGQQSIGVSKTGYVKQSATIAGDAPLEVRLVRAAAISGRVVDDVGEPVVAAQVTLGLLRVTEGSSGTPGLQITRDARGEYIILPPGGGMVMGTMVDGKFVASAAQERTAQSLRMTVVAEAETNDKGEYRIGGLTPGTFVVATARVARAPVFFEVPASSPAGGIVSPVTIQPASVSLAAPSTIFFPGVINPSEAQGIDLRAGDDRYGIDFAVEGVSELPSAVRYTGTLSIEALDSLVATDGNVAEVLANLERSAQARARTDSPTAPTPTGRIRGRVVDANDRPVPYAHVRIGTAVGMPEFGTTTVRASGDGRFEFHELPLGAHAVAAAKTGYFFVRSPSFDVEEQKAGDEVQIRLADRWAALEGRVVDERGDPLQSALVSLLAVHYEAGRLSFAGSNVKSVRSDDLGRFRLYGVRAGRYVVCASMGSIPTAEWPGYPCGYYPGTNEAGLARPIQVAAGSETSGIDIALPRVRPVRITGTALQADGTPSDAVARVQLLPRGVGDAIPARMQSVRDFEFSSMPAGQYVLHVSFGPANDWTEEAFGAYSLSVGDADMDALMVPAMASSSIAGRMTFNAARATRPPRESVGIVAVPVDPEFAPKKLATANVRNDWTFQLAGITGTRRLQVVRVPAGWAVEAVRMNGTDITDRPFVFGGEDRSLRDVEIVLTDRISTVAGTVVDDRGVPSSQASVLVYSADPANWYHGSRFLRMATTQANGTFTIAGLPPGTYNTVATVRPVTDSVDAWQEPEYLRAMAERAQKVSIVQGQPAAVQLRIRN